MKDDELKDNGETKTNKTEVEMVESSGLHYHEKCVIYSVHH